VRKGAVGRIATVRSERPIPRRPLLGLTAAFLAGAWIGFRLETCVEWVLVAGLGLALLSLVGRGRWAGAALFAAVVCAGWARTAAREERASPVSIERTAVRPEEYARLLGVITSDPVLRTYPSGRSLWIFRLQVEAVHQTGWVRSLGEVDITLAGDLAAPLGYGDRIELAGRFRQPDGPGARPRLSASAPSIHRRAQGCGWGVTDLAYRLRRQAQRILWLGLENSPDEAAVQTALLLGLRDGLSEDLHSAFQRIGTFHVFAISGLHVGILCAFWIGALQLAGWPRYRWVFILVPLLWGYVLATGLPSSAVRAAIMASGYVAAAAAGRRPDGPSSLAVAALGSVVAAPRQMLDTGFIFSFTVVAGLLTAAPLLAALREKTRPEDPWPGQIVPARIRFVRSGLRILMDLALVSAVAGMASTPLTAWYSNRVSPAALIGNLFTVPAAFGIVLIGCFSLLSGLFSSVLAEVFNHANRILIHALNSATVGLMNVPGAYVCLPRPSPGWFFGWYTAWIFALYLRGKVRRWGLAVLLILGAVSAIRQFPGSSLRAESFDSGGVPTTVIRRSFRTTLVADPGPRYQAASLIRELRARGINRIDALLLRLPLSDWASAAPAVVDEIPVREVWAPEAGWRFPAFRRLMEEIETRGVPVRRLRSGDSWILPGGEEVDVFHPEAAASAKAASAALAIRVAYEAGALVLAGPVDEDLASSVASCASDPKAELLIAVLSASDPAGWRRVLEVLRPKEVRLLLPESVPLTDAVREPLRELGIRWTEPRPEE